VACVVPDAARGRARSIEVHAGDVRDTGVREEALPAAVSGTR
jgi:hypothetical protein